MGGQATFLASLLDGGWAGEISGDDPATFLWTGLAARRRVEVTFLRRPGSWLSLISTNIPSMIAKDDQPPDEPLYWGVHSHKSRLIVYSPEPNWFIYIVCLGRVSDR